MKKLFVFSFLLILSSSNIFSQSGWFWQNPLPQGNPLNKCCIISDETAVIVGAANTIIKTTDGGNTWINYALRLPNNCNNQSVFFLNDQTGWIGAQDLSGPGDYQAAKVYKTNNGGTNWTQTCTLDAYSINKIQFINSQTGYLSVGLPDGVLMKSTNGGEDWFFSDCFYGPSIKNDFVFINENTGWLIYSAPNPYQNNNIVYKTTNGGVNWEFNNPGFNSPNLTSIHFINSSTGWISADSNSIFQSTDGGTNWVAINTNSDYRIIRTDFADGQNGWAFGRKSSIYSDSTAVLRTSNGGAIWSISQLPKNNLNGLCFYNNIGWTFQDYTILKSTNSGINWSYKSDTNGYNSINSVFFIDSSFGWAVSPIYHFLKTTDGGARWEKAPIDINNTVFHEYVKVQFINRNTGWILNGARVAKTTNSGQNWFSIYDTTSYSGIFNDMHFFDENNAIVSSGSFLLRTSNGGNSWYRQYVDFQDRSIKKIKFMNNSTGWLVVNASFSLPSAVYKTTNSGQNWIPIFNTDNDISDLHFLDNNKGWIISQEWNITSFGVLNYTSNGGETWSRLIPNSSYYPGFSKVYFKDENTGWIVGYSQLFTTTNGGNSWSVNSIMSDWISDIFFLNGNTGWITSGGGNILKTTNSGGLASSEGILQTIPEIYILHQNYPNPFNPITKIKFDIPYIGQRHAFDTKIIIYDMLGREITTLVNEQLKPGSYEVNWDGTGFASGVYFYSLITTDYVETKRLVLLK